MRAKDLEPLDQLGHALAAIEAPHVREIGPLPEGGRGAKARAAVREPRRRVDVQADAQHGALSVFAEAFTNEPFFFRGEEHDAVA